MYSRYSLREHAPPLGISRSDESRHALNCPAASFACVMSDRFARLRSRAAGRHSMAPFDPSTGSRQGELRTGFALLAAPLRPSTSSGQAAALRSGTPRREEAVTN